MKKRNSIFGQLITVFLGCMIGFIFILSLFLFYTNMKVLVTEKRNESKILARNLKVEMERNKNLAWLVNYWYENADDMDIIYDDIAVFGEKFEEIYILAEDEMRKGALAIDIEALNEEAQKVYAQYMLMFYTFDFNGAKEHYDCKYLFFVKPVDDNNIKFLISGKLSEENRGRNKEDIYTVGVIAEAPHSKYQKLYDTYKLGTSMDNDSIIYVDKQYIHYEPVKDRDGNTIGVIGVSVGAEEIYNALISVIVGSVLLSIVVISLLSLFVYNRLMQIVIVPIMTIQKGVKEFGEGYEMGKLRAELSHTKSNNELGLLSNDIEKMGDALVSYIEESTRVAVEKQKTKSEIALATKIQLSVLSVDFDVLPASWNSSIYACMNPARQVGGDFYGFVNLDDTHLVLYIADVSGKGIPAALYMMNVKVLIDNGCRHSLDPKDILENVNSQISASNSTGMFVTVWLGILDMESGIITTANAGHEYPIIKKSDGSVRYIKDKHGLVVGAMEDMHYNNEEILLEEGDMLLVYTDGVTEATDKANKMYGMERLLSSVADFGDCSPKEMIEHVRNDIDAFTADAEQFDDITMLCFKYRR